MRLWRGMLLTVVLLYIGYLALLYSAQREMIYPGMRRAAAGLPKGAEGQIWLATPSGRVEARFLPPIGAAEGKRPAMIYAHGNGEVMEDAATGLDGFRRRGIGVLLVEYPGYGRSEGLPSEGSIRDTVLAAYDFLVAKPGVDNGRVLAFGSSLGGGAVCLLARERPLAALILQSTFTSLRHFSWRYAAPPFLVKDRFDNLGAVRGYAGPVFVAHGKNDRAIPWREGEALAHAAPHGELHLYDFAHGCDLSQIPIFEDLDPFLAKAHILPPS